MIRVNKKHSFERKFIAKESEDMIETVEELNEFLSDLIDYKVDVTDKEGAEGLKNPNHNYMTMTMKAKKHGGDTEISCLIPDVEEIDWSGYVDDVVENIKKWKRNTDEEESIINAMLERLTDYYFFNVGDGTVEVESFTLPISKEEVEDIILEDVNDLEKEVERFVVDKFYDEVKERSKKESKQIRCCEITQKIKDRIKNK